ncbi:hypothetical protein FPQ18DRAFT_78069 [Pyronema domesticum]|nr:hypothetical protein FPQ18DRAFT_78069 [Pyronema domesticum]
MMAIEKPEDQENDAHLLDTSIDSGIWALGISDNHISTSLSSSSGDPTPNSASGESEAQSQFDFIHIRYRSGKITPRVWRVAFEQTKPGGWIEVVESENTNTPRPRIKSDLVRAGFVEVEDRIGGRVTGGTMWQRLAGLVRGVLSMGMGAADCGGNGDNSVFVIARKPCNL